MLLLTSTSDLLQVVTGSAVTTDVHASWVDDAAGVITPGRTNTAISTAATTTVVASPGASTQRNIQTLNIRNRHISSSVTVTVKHNDGTTAAELISYTLLAQEQLQYVDGEGWKIIDASGIIKSGVISGITGLVPIGGIIMWSGTIASITSPWALCDGTANAPGPDLRDKFVVGASQDSGGVAKTNIRGSLEQSASATGHLHSAHGNLTHAGGSVADHTGLTHNLAIANHPDLTHAALSHAALTFTHADHSAASQSHTHAGSAFIPDHSIASGSHTHAGSAFIGDHSVASFSGTHASQTGTVASGTHSHAGVAISQATILSSLSNTGVLQTLVTGSANQSLASFTATHASQTLTIASGTHSHAAQTLTHGSLASFSGTDAAFTLTHGSLGSFSGTSPAATYTHADHSFPSLSHQAIGSHLATDYGVHTFTKPADHGAAGTVTHSFTQPGDHTISAHDTVSMVPSFFALAFIQRMS